MCKQIDKIPEFDRTTETYFVNFYLVYQEPEFTYFSEEEVNKI